VPDPTSTKPYLLRALYEWCVDNGFTPYISVVVDAATRVPPEYVRNGEIVLNVGPLAANRLKMGNETIDFSARFGGVARELSIPIAQVAAIYARENGHGMSFEIDRNKTPWEASGEAAAQPAATPEPPTPAPGGGKPTLRVIK
jgi:stringent starvation protein B